jgi:hypothetical protein
VDVDTAASKSQDWTVLLGVAGVVCGWFFFSSLTTDLGALQLQFYFYNVLTLMRAPARITIGASGDGATLDAWLFGTLCVVAVLAALAPLVSQRKIAWLGCLAPLALMALVGVVLYHVLSQDLIDNNGMLGDTGLRLSRFANELANKVSGVITRRIHVGLGGYLSMAASAYLAYTGLRGYQRAP